MDKKTLQAFRINLARWYQKEKRALPWRLHSTPYRIAVAEFMCQQTQINTVLPYYDRWMKKFPDWQSLASANESIVLKHWEGLGYYRRARLLHALAKKVVTLPSCELPAEAHLLQKLPGIGPYTAGAIASIAFGERVALVDGNVERVLCRVFNIRKIISKNELQKFAEKLLPTKNVGDFNQALMECGSQICAPRNPRCKICPLNRACLAKNQNPEKLPLKKRENSISEQETLALICKNKKVWLSLPPSPRRWKGFYRLPDFDVSRMKAGRELATHNYAITKYRIRAKVVEAWPLQKLSHGKWFSFSELEKIFLPASHRRMMNRF